MRTGLKQPEHEKDYSPLSSAEVNKWSYTAAPPSPKCVYGVDRGNFTFLYLAKCCVKLKCPLETKFQIWLLLRPTTQQGQ
jgi:hypothetical protein